MPPDDDGSVARPTSSQQLPDIATTAREKAMETAAALSNLIPLVGGALSSVLSGLAADQKMARVEEVLRYLLDHINEAEVTSTEFLKQDEFRDFLEATLRQVYEETHLEKRRLYGALLLGVIEEPLEPYDPRRRYLKTIDEIQPGQIALLREIRNHVPWSQRDDIKGLSDIPVPYAQDRVFIETNQDALEHMKSMDLVTFAAPRPGRNPEPNIRTVPAYPQLTGYGQRFVEFIVDSRHLSPT